MTARILILASLALAVALGATSPALATTWDGRGFNDNLSTGTNWVTNIAPPNNGTGNFTFSGSLRPNPNAAVPWSIGTVVFGDIGESFRLGGQQLTVYGSITNDSRYHNIIENFVVLGDYLSVYSNEEDITFSNHILQNGFPLSARGNHETILSGNANAGTLRTDGGKLRVEGFNTSGMELDGGTLIIATNVPWGLNSSSPTALVQSSSTVQVPGTVNTPNYLYDLDGGDLTLDVSGDYTFGGFATIGLGRTLFKTGTGIARMGAGASGFLGAINVATGTLSLEGSPSGNYHWGSIVVGNGVGGPDADVLQTFDSSSLYLSSILVNSSGLLQMDGTEDNIHDVTLQGGAIDGVDYVLDRITTQFSPETARIAGLWSAHGDTIEIDVAPGNFGTDVDIDANIVGAHDKLFLKEGNGIARLIRGNSGYNFKTHVDNGTLVLAAPFAPILNTISAGDGTVNGASSDAVIKLEEDHQINGQDVILNAAGSLNVGYQTDSVGNLQMSTYGVSMLFSGELTLNGDVTTTGAAFIPSFTNGSLVLAAGDHDFNIADGPHEPDASIYSPISGTGNLIKRGSGTLGIFTSSPFTGGTEIADGAISVSYGLQYALGQQPLLLSPGGTLRLKPGGSLSLKGLESAPGSSLDLQGGTLTFNGGTARFPEHSFAYGFASTDMPKIIVENGCDVAVLESFIIGSSPGAQARAEVLSGSATQRSTLRNRDEDFNSNLVVGRGGMGSLIVEDGALVEFLSDVMVGREPGSDGQIILSGTGNGHVATLSAGDVLSIGGGIENGGTGLVEVQNGSLLDVENTIQLWSDGVLRQNGGTIRAVTMINDLGTTEMLGGTLIVETISSSLTLNGSELSPGGSIGSTSIADDFNIITGSVKIDLGGLTPIGSHDQVSVQGTAALNGTLNVTLYADYVPSPGDSFTILTAGTLTGEFETVNLPTLPEGQLFVVYDDNAVRLVVSTATAVVDLPFIPDSFGLAQNAPNPFNPSTEISFDLPSASDVTLDVFDLAGRRVARLADGAWAAGRHQVRWAGTDAQGRAVASGVYAYVFQAADYREVRRMLLLK